MTAEQVHGPADPNVFALIADRARHSSDGRLIANVVGGGVLAVLVLILRPSLWPLVLLGTAFVAYGIWGVLERAEIEHRARARRVGMLVAAIVGFGSALAFALISMLVLFSGWIS